MPVFAIADNITSPLGNTTDENFQAVLNGKTGISQHSIPAIHSTPFYAALFNQPELQHGYSRFEQILIHSISEALRHCAVDIKDANTAIIISTTKGNISLLEQENYQPEQLTLFASAEKIARHFGNPNKPVVVSNACISGLTALATAKRMIDAGFYKNVVVAGADTISKFVFSGFNAFQAISPEPCRPYDASRKGVTLGEAAGTIILSSEKTAGAIILAGGSASNDANHISGPSRTGVELAIAMQKAMDEASVNANDIDFISAHGTATIYNDEMESKAITLAGLQQVPMNSLKGYYGHTLGAAGIIESVIALESMRQGIALPTKGFEQLGVPMPINVLATTQKMRIDTCLKTGSGFGGCNAAVVWTRIQG